MITKQKDSKSDKLLTGADLEQVFSQLQIQKGSTVLLQADLSRLPNLCGQETALVETILRMIGPKGLLIVPAWTIQALDPACQTQFSPNQWSLIRHAHPGYSPKTMPADRLEKSAAAVLLHYKAKRSDHPAYSFAWIGQSSCKPDMEGWDFPLSYRHVLQSMDSPEALNLLVGVNLDEAIYPMLEAHKKGKISVTRQCAFNRKVSQVFDKPFLHYDIKDPGNERWEDLDVSGRQIGNVPVYKVTQKADFSKTRHTDVRLF